MDKERKTRFVKRVETYGYAVARLRARKSFLLTTSDYESLLKIGSTRELLHVVSRSPLYGRYLEGLEGLTLDDVERRLWEAQAKALDDVKKMIRGPTSLFLDYLQRKFELETLRTLVRVKAFDLPLTEALKYVIPIGSFTRERIEEMLRAKDLLRMIDMVGDEELERKLMAALEKYKSLNNPLPLEAAIDRYMDYVVSKGAEKLPRTDRRWVLKFLNVESDLKNIVLAVRSKSLNLAIEDFNEYIVLPHYFKVTPEAINKAFTAPSVDVAIQTLASLTPYGSVLLKAGSDPISLEREAKRYLIEEYRKVFFYNPFNMGFVYAFLNLLYLELSNIKTLIIGRHDELPSELIAESLLI